MKYLICYSWNNTRGNHAGFLHICNLLKTSFSKDYTVITDYGVEKKQFVSNPFINRIINTVDRRYHARVYRASIRRMMRNLHNGDEVFLMEYLHQIANQKKMAFKIREEKPNVRIYGLAHLTPSALEQSFAKEDYEKWTQPINAYLTLGSSLTSFLLEKTHHTIPVYTLFHPVDRSYFFPLNIDKQCFTVIALGNLQRTYDLLEVVVEKMPQVKFILCAGFADLSSFEKYPNATVMGYMPESELRRQLSKADISLNVMDDTVGSNVITISMAMHLAMVVSDVGSIRDYCSEDNALFCKEVDDYVKAISFLSANPVVLKRFQEASAQKAERLSVERFNDLIKSISA